VLSGKHRYPFRLATTSFIYPAGYAANVEKLAPFVDEIELLLFESDPGAWPSRDEIHRLSDLAQDFELTYNIHLPLDVALGDPERATRDRGVTRLARLLEHIASLPATTHTLHLACTAEERSHAAVSAWQALTSESLAALLARTSRPSRLFSIETLDYPPWWFAPIVEDQNLSVCVDVGHLLRYGFDLAQTLADFRDRITIVHLHGIEAGQDHRALAYLPLSARAIVLPFLQDFSGSVSLELFSLDLLEDSMVTLSDMMAVTDAR
jgi:sugar phosphate isomerase/epimerase